MLDLPSIDGGAEQFGLHGEDRGVRGIAPRIPETSATIALTPARGTPITRELTADDPELAAFWQAEQGKFRYHYVTFRATFVPDAAGFDDARLAVQLGPSEPANGVIAWSISPQLLADPTKSSESAKIGRLQAGVGGNGRRNRVQRPELFSPRVDGTDRGPVLGTAADLAAALTADSREAEGLDLIGEALEVAGEALPALVAPLSVLRADLIYTSALKG
jgi:hypothetical protein